MNNKQNVHCYNLNFDPTLTPLSLSLSHNKLWIKLCGDTFKRETKQWVWIVSILENRTNMQILPQKHVLKQAYNWRQPKWKFFCTLFFVMAIVFHLKLQSWHQGLCFIEPPRARGGLFTDLCIFPYGGTSADLSWFTLLLHSARFFEWWPVNCPFWGWSEKTGLRQKACTGKVNHLKT